MGPVGAPSSGRGRTGRQVSWLCPGPFHPPAPLVPKERSQPIESGEKWQSCSVPVPSHPSVRYLLFPPCPASVALSPLPQPQTRTPAMAGE